jgi:hypothetical protein
MKQVVNDALRTALRAPAAPACVTVDVPGSAVLAGLDRTGFSRLAGRREDRAKTATAGGLPTGWGGPQ